ncbi:hypothetical protein [Prescottella equi]|uniref:hypothetical protein n=1 Tax=Rhodococcus hoagii TaxID=43767 RepID=UPI001EEA31DE|nr:hypothetical protein [Prescottella equi]
MMPTLLSRKSRTARKAHACMTCHSAIRPATEYVRETFLHDGQIYDWVSCQPCRDMFDLVWSWAYADDGIDADHYAEWADEFEDDPQHGETAHAFLERRRNAAEASDGAQ